MLIIVSMKIIIVGVGKIGKTLVANFINEEHDVVVIDNKRQAVETLVNSYDVKGLVGGALEREYRVCFAGTGRGGSRTKYLPSSLQTASCRATTESPCRNVILNRSGALINRQ